MGLLLASFHESVLICLLVEIIHFKKDNE